MSEEHTCVNCGMAFDKAEHLNKHQQKFCVGSGYGDVESLEAKYNQQFRSGNNVTLPTRKIMQPRLPDQDDDAYQLELDKQRIRQGGLAQREYNKLLEQIRFEEEKKYNTKAQKQRLLKELRQLEGMEAGQLAFQKQEELEQLTRKKRVLEMEEDSLKNQLDQFLNKKRQLEQEDEMQSQQVRMRGSHARAQLDRVKNLEDDFAVNQGRKMAELQIRRQNLEQQRKNIESNLQQIRQKKGNPEAYQPSQAVKLPANAYTFKPQPFDKVESYRKLAAMNDTGEQAQEKLHMINSQIANRTGTPNTQLIQKRRRELDDLKKEYQSNGGDDPQFFNKIKVLEKRYEIAESKVGVRQQKPMNIEHRPYQPPKMGQSQVSEVGPQPLNPFYNPNSPFEMYDKFAVKPGQAPQQPSYVLAPNTFGNNERLLLQERIAPDQSIEERVLSSVMAQEYDSLQILSRLPKNSQIYKLKLKQYEQLTKVRQDLIKQAHLQRLLRVKRQFEMEKKLAEKDINNDQFVDRVRRNIIDGRLENPPAMSNRMQFFVNTEMISGLPIQAARAKINMTIYKDGQKVAQPKQTKEVECQKKDNGQLCRVHERITCAIQPRANLVAVFQVLLSHRDSPQNFKVFSYGTVKLTNQQMRVGASNYQLSMFQPPYKPLAPSQNKQQIPNHNIYLKIYQGDQPLNVQYVNPKGISHKTEYEIFNNKPATAFGGTNRSFRPNTQGSQLQIVPSSQRNAPQSGPKGFEFRNIIVRTQKPQETLWVQFALYEEDTPMKNSKGASLQHKTSYVHTVDMGKRVNNLASARVNESYRIYQDLERQYKKNQRQLFLMIMLMQKQSSESMVRGWHCLRLTNFQQVREGIVKVNLFAPKQQYPPVDMNKVEGKMRDQIEFEITQFVPTIQEIQKNVKPKTAQKKKTNKLPLDKSTKKALPSQRSRQKLPPTNRNSNQSVFEKLSHALSRKTMSYQTVTDPNQSQTSLMNDTRRGGKSTKSIKGDSTYIPNQAMGVQNTPKSECGTFQLHISKLRFIPGGIGIAKINIVLVGRKGAVMDTPTTTPVIYNDNHNVNDQTIDFGKVFNGGDKFPHDAMIMMEILTYHEDSGETGYLGCAIMPVFVDIKGQQFLSEGHFQLPIFWALHTTQFDIDVAFSMPKVPCVSLLISIGKKLDTDNIPEYSSGKFCTVFFNIDNMEQRLLHVMGNQPRHTYSQSLAKYFKTQGITRKYSKKQIQAFFEKTIKFERMLLNLNHLIPYDSSFGFSINIDGLLNATGSNLFLITVCVSPPAHYYHKEKMDLVFLTAVDPRSHRRFPLYDNNTFSFNEPYDPNMCFIIEITQIHLVNIQNFEVSLVSYGYCVVPAFQQNSPYVNAGQFTMPLCDGDYPEEKVALLKTFGQNREDVMVTEAEMMDTKLKLRVVNNYFPEQYLAPSPQTLVEMATGKRPKAIKEQDQVVSMLPKNIEPNKFFQLLDECIFRLYEDDEGD